MISRRQVLAIAGAFIGLAVMATDALAQPRPAWVTLGCRDVGFIVDRDVIPVGRRDGRFCAIRLRVTGNAIHMLDLKVVYGNGAVDDIPVRARIPEGGMTRPLDLRGANRVINQIEMVYQRVPNFRGRATICADGLI